MLAFGGMGRCPRCGATMPSPQLADHVCDENNLIDKEVRLLRQELETKLLDAVSEWSNDVHAAFERYYDQYKRGKV